MSNGDVLRRALLGLCAATLGGMAASAGVVHLRSQLAETAQATTFSCTQRASHHRSSRLQAALSKQPRSQTLCRAIKPYVVRITGSTTANRPPVVAVPVQGQNKTYAVTVVDRQSPHSGIFVDGGSVTYGGVTYCSRSCPTAAGQSHGAIVPVTIVDVHYNGDNKKTAAKP